MAAAENGPISRPAEASDQTLRAVRRGDGMSSSSSHKAKGDRAWAVKLYGLTRPGGRTLLRRGEAPPTGKWKTEYDKVKECPKQRDISRQRRHQQTTLNTYIAGAGGSGELVQCTCGWHDGAPNPSPLLHLVPPASTQATATAAGPAGPVSPQPPPPQEQLPRRVDFGLLQRPSPRTSILDVRDKHCTYQKDGRYDLVVFGRTDGRCPVCGSSIDPSHHKLNSSLKIIHTKGHPRFAQGIGLKCFNRACRATFQSYEESYVQTLPKHMRTLNAIIAGAADGVDMEIVVDLRIGHSAKSVEDASRANLMRYHNQRRAAYEQKCATLTSTNIAVEDRAFPSLDDSLVCKASMATRAFLRDFATQRPWLYSEMASNKSEQAMACDHQAKVVRRSKDKEAQQSFTVVGDGGLVLVYIAVPDGNMKWVDTAMVELVKRHGATLDPSNRHRVTERGSLPFIIYVDTDCCNGHHGGRTDETKWFYGMIKKLDLFHLICRIGRIINSEHNRQGALMRQVSMCIFTVSQDDVRKLDAARLAGNVDVATLTKAQLKYDRTTYVRRVVRDAQLIASKLMLVLKGHMLLDRQAMIQQVLSGKSCDNLSPAHQAYPLVTKKVMNCFFSQCTHILNGYVLCDFNVF